MAAGPRLTGVGPRLLRCGSKSTEHGLRIAKTLETAVLSDLYPRSTIDVFVQVVQADGGASATGRARG